MTQTINDFHAIKVKLLPSSLTSHTFFIKEHTVREYSENRPSGRTLFVLNIPPFLNELSVKEIFGAYGKIEFLELNSKPGLSENIENNTIFQSENLTNFKVAYIVYSKQSDLKKILQLNVLKTPKTSLTLYNGIAKWVKNYNESIPNIEEMKGEIDNFMTKYDKELKEKVEKEKVMNEPDDDGWITVTKQGRKSGFERKESVTNKILAHKQASQQKKELKNFYTFQIRESKMNHIIALRKKFEEDKKKIAMLKQSRRFKPF